MTRTGRRLATHGNGQKKRVEGGIWSLFLRVVVRFLEVALFRMFVAVGLFWLMLYIPVPWDFGGSIGERNFALILGAIPLLWEFLGIFCFDTLLDLARRFSIEFWVMKTTDERTRTVRLFV